MKVHTLENHYPHLGSRIKIHHFIIMTLFIENIIIIFREFMENLVYFMLLPKTVSLRKLIIFVSNFRIYDFHVMFSSLSL